MGTNVPGSSIDVYEWVESHYYQANGIQVLSGNSIWNAHCRRFAVHSGTEDIDSRLDRFVNFYYYWVKGKTTLPSNIAQGKTQ